MSLKSKDPDVGPSVACNTAEGHIMLGWMILFALMALPGAAETLSGYPSSRIRQDN